MTRLVTSTAVVVQDISAEPLAGLPKLKGHSRVVSTDGTGTHLYILHTVLMTD